MPFVWSHVISFKHCFYEGTYGEDLKYNFSDLLFFWSSMSLTVSSLGEVTVKEKLQAAFV
jgi:hypothetical protein